MQAANKRKIGLGTVFHYAKQNGFKFPNDPTEPPDWTSPETFGEPVLFGEIETPEITSDFLPPWIRDYVDAIAEETQTPLAMATLLVLAILAACLQKKYIVAPYGDGYHESLAIWILLALPPASRKTAVLQKLLEPIIEWELLREEMLRPEINMRNTRREIALKRIEHLTREASKREEL